MPSGFVTPFTQPNLFPGVTSKYVFSLSEQIPLAAVTHDGDVH
jgi:hypothetical protein